MGGARWRWHGRRRCGWLGRPRRGWHGRRRWGWLGRRRWGWHGRRAMRMAGAAALGMAWAAALGMAGAARDADGWGGGAGDGMGGGAGDGWGGGAGDGMGGRDKSRPYGCGCVCKAAIYRVPLRLPRVLPRLRRSRPAMAWAARDGDGMGGARCGWLGRRRGWLGRPRWRWHGRRAPGMAWAAAMRMAGAAAIDRGRTDADVYVRPRFIVCGSELGSAQCIGERTELRGHFGEFGRSIGSARACPRSARAGGLRV
jgi:hypothetical protein